MAKKRLLGRFLTSTMLTGVAAGGAAVPAFAQDDAAASEDTVVVTGSRIAREDLAAPSPVAQIDSEQLTLTNTVNSEQFLNTLPQVIPGLDSSSNNPGNGTATVQLRGLGAVRTLVLVDGSRFVPSGPGGVVDLNSIPAALLERIEVVTGGASAVYGSDAIAGVVNFILKDDFEGIQLDVSDEMSVAGWDANTFNVALTMGGNFADGRGNAVMSLAYTNRHALLQGDRAFSEFTVDDTAGGFVNSGSGSVLGGQWFSLDSDSNWDTSAAPGQQPYVCGSPLPSTCTAGMTFNGNADGRAFANPDDAFNFAPYNYLQVPQERYSIYAAGTYEINDHMEAYARGVFASSNVATVLAPTPVSGTFTVSLDNPFLTPAFVTTLQNTYDQPGEISDLDLDGEVDDVQVFMARRYTETDVRLSDFENNTFQFKGGVRGDLSDNWNYDVFAQFGRVIGSAAASGNISFSKLKTGIRNGTMNVFGVNTLDPVSAAAISVTAISTVETEQTQIVGSISGHLDGIKMPYADTGIGVAFGLEYREEAGAFLPDSAAGPDVRGFNAALPISGRYDVYEAFMETEIPIIENKPFIDSFTINGAYRFSSYSTAANTTHTFAVGGDWVPIEGLRIRSQFQRAVRAPNIAELFAPQVNGFVTVQDPCSSNRGKYDELTDGNPANGEVPAATLIANCSAYGVPVPGAGTQTSAQIESLFGGNPNLQAEVSDTLTIGAVWQPSMVDGLTIVVDFYDIDVQGGISTAPIQQTLDRCYIQGITSVCDQYFGPGTRSPTGRFVFPTVPFFGNENLATLSVRGIDGQVSYGFDLPETWGSVNLRYFGSYTLKNGFQADALSPFTDCVGTYGATCAEPTPTYKHTMQASWLWGPLTTSVRWRLIGGVSDDGTGGAVLVTNVPMFNYVDVTLGYALSEHLDFTVGVQNITGKNPPIIGSCCNEQANTWPGTYETLGRQLFFGASLRF